MDFSWLLVLAGALVGFSVGLTGMGGGALMTPIMVILFGINPTTAVGSDLTASLVMKPIGAAVHHTTRTIRWDIVRWLLPTAIPAAFAGAFALPLLGHGDPLQHHLRLAIGTALLLAVLGILARALLGRRTTETPHTQARPVPTLIIGLTGGLIVGVTSVGSGSLIIVMLMLTHPRLRANELVGTDLVQAIPMVAAAALGHLIVGDTSFGLAGTVLIGAIPGIIAGSLLSARAPSAFLRWTLAILLLGSGLALWHIPTPAALISCATLAILALARAGIRRAMPGRRPQPEPARSGS
ncbi:sulfite exporter TauE/SafE family protein [Amycolatopsis alkalitolerans]|uniref:Probable membrane transporter protein n=1 Tax=Amycolatopsis alkalitolerans TaxID=2547244 RepID=A0A5C4LT82_9PSEU|nr:sulfite exporter TauE/SafE family protein [Amycolatopsis alkalitolerans]TNC22227.1 sulfite exporter TauE/SafE family protein [Amycolatopsis alkalitolerans]